MMISVSASRVGLGGEARTNIWRPFFTQQQMFPILRRDYVTGGDVFVLREGSRTGDQPSLAGQAGKMLEDGDRNQIKEGLEEASVMDREQCGEQEASAEIGLDGQYVGNNTEHPLSSLDNADSEDDNSEDDATSESSEGEPVNPKETFSCSDCGKNFARKRYLQIHQTWHLRVDKPFGCSVCGICFRLESELVSHHRYHTGVYPCSECGKVFKKKVKLVVHERSHTGERPFSCATCGKSFAAKSTLVAHEIVHTGLRPYSCPTCGKSFNHPSSLRNHKKLVCDKK
ncbi:zinc finger protein 660-like [Hyperolius riggenbachi]|uniref:zinc finger protein 660-like n=1 Tax=Hyperolius riggenbachi TaxID=752182 RepID=UPI0035A3A5F7